MEDNSFIKAVESIPNLNQTMVEQFMPVSSNDNSFIFPFK
jgi:hypothetical protein